MSKVKVQGREYISLSVPFFKAAMAVIHEGNEYKEDYIPNMQERIIKFSQSNMFHDKVLVSKEFMSWMEVSYHVAETTPLPWRPTNAKQSTSK